jgi:hypothetical protein
VAGLLIFFFNAQNRREKFTLLYGGKTPTLQNFIFKKEVTKMDEMNNVTMENETSMEAAPVESVVPAEAENPAYNNDCESSAGISFGTIVKVGAGAVLVGAAAVKFGIPLVKKGFNHIKESIANKKMKKNEVIDVESKEVPSDEETTEEE